MAAINPLDCSVFTRFLGYQLAIGWLSASHDTKSIHFKTVIYYVPKLHMDAINTLDCSMFSKNFWLLAGWQWPKTNTLQDIVINYYVPKLHMAAINTWDCIVFMRFCCYWMAISWPCPQIHFKTLSYTTYQSGTWL